MVLVRAAAGGGWVGWLQDHLPLLLGSKELVFSAAEAAQILPRSGRPQSTAGFTPTSDLFLIPGK